jgi:hypothetical protein
LRAFSASDGAAAAGAGVAGGWLGAGAGGAGSVGADDGCWGVGGVEPGAGSGAIGGACGAGSGCWPDATVAGTAETIKAAQTHLQTTLPMCGSEGCDEIRPVLRDGA